MASIPFYIVINIVQDFLLLAFILLSVRALRKKKKEVYGVMVYDGEKLVADGMQGLEATLGKSWHNDIRVNESEKIDGQAVISYNSYEQTYETREYGKKGYIYADAYLVDGHEFVFDLPKISRPAFSYGFAPLMLCVVFIFTQAASTLFEWRNPLVIVPHMILLVYVLVSLLGRADRTAIIECIFAVLLTYYIDAMLYPARYSDILSSSITSAIVGVTMYVCCAAIANRLFRTKGSGAQSRHALLRVLCTLGIVVLIVVNIALRKEINGTYNWITIGSLTFQPSEIVKLFFLLAMVIPTGQEFGTANGLYMGLLAIACLVYGTVIKDMGLVLQFVLIAALAVVVQSNKFWKPLAVTAALFIGFEVILRISSTAQARFQGWVGEGFSIFEVVTGAGIFMNADSYGYQSVHSLVAAFKNGGLFGNNSFDVMKGITATNSDLVMGFIGQKHGIIALFLVISLYVLLVFAVLQNIKQQKRLQQKMSILGVSLIIFTMILNLAGTFGILALTGVVSPAVSAGISAAISYGGLFGIISSTTLDVGYLECLYRKTETPPKQDSDFFQGGNPSPSTLHGAQDNIFDYIQD